MSASLDRYEGEPTFYDEAFEAPGRPRPHYVELLARLGEIDLGRLAADVKTQLREAGVTFGAAPDGMLALDPISRLITAEEWQRS